MADFTLPTSGGRCGGGLRFNWQMLGECVTYVRRIIDRLPSPIDIRLGHCCQDGHGMRQTHVCLLLGAGGESRAV